MELEDQRMIDQTLKTHQCEVEVIYWKLEDAIYDGKPDVAKLMLIMLLYMGRYRPDLIQSGLKIPQRKRMKEIVHDILGNGAMRQCTSITMKPAVKSKKIPFKLESELKKYIVDNPQTLNDAIGQKVRISGTEVETDNEFKCDITAENEEFFYPVELKIIQGNHAVVSQCSKYCYYFYRKFRYGMFKNIQGIVIAPGYDDWCINALRREGHWIYEIMNVDDCVHFRKIEG